MTFIKVLCVFIIALGIVSRNIQFICWNATSGCHIVYYSIFFFLLIWVKWIELVWKWQEKFIKAKRGIDVWHLLELPRCLGLQLLCKNGLSNSKCVHEGYKLRVLTVNGTGLGIGLCLIMQLDYIFNSGHHLFNGSLPLGWTCITFYTHMPPPHTHTHIQTFCYTYKTSHLSMGNIYIYIYIYTSLVS